jgi:Tfp pilus assembly protein FimT
MTTGRKRCVSGFTLLELLVVMGIMILMMSMGITGYLGIRRGAEMRGAVSSVRTTLMLARQQAVTKRQTVTVSFQTTNLTAGITNHYMRIMERTSDGSNIISHSDAYLPVGVEFGGGESPVSFYPSGRAGGVSESEIIVREKSAYQMSAQPQSQTITVWPLTGVTKVEDTP